VNRVDNLNHILDILKDSECLAFLGAGAGSEFNDFKGNNVPGLPRGAQLAKTLAEQCNSPQNLNGDLAKTAEYFLFKKGGDRQILVNAVRDEILKPGCEPRPIHYALAQLKPVKIVITTNYDRMMEEAAQKYRKLIWHFYDRFSSQNARFDHPPSLKDDEVVVYKMHGTVEKPESMVITESDYIFYLAHIYDRERGIPDFFRKTWLPYCTLLFLGYSLEDFDFKVIWEGMLSDYRLYNPNKKAFALVKDMDDYKIDFWRDRNIKVIKYDLTDFSRDLALHFKLDIPQLDIKQGIAGGRA